MLRDERLLIRFLHTEEVFDRLKVSGIILTLGIEIRLARGIKHGNTAKGYRIGIPRHIVVASAHVCVCKLQELLIIPSGTGVLTDQIPVGFDAVLHSRIQGFERYDIILVHKGDSVGQSSLGRIGNHRFFKLRRTYKHYPLDRKELKKRLQIAFYPSVIFRDGRDDHFYGFIIHMYLL